MREGLITHSKHLLHGGVSQQNSLMRHESQCETQENILTDLVHGIRKRPPTEYISRLVTSLSTSTYSDDACVHFATIDDANYLLIFTGNTSTPLEAWNIDSGVKLTVVYTDSFGIGKYYLSNGLSTVNPNDGLRIINIANSILVCNTTITPEMLDSDDLGHMSGYFASVSDAITSFNAGWTSIPTTWTSMGSAITAGNNISVGSLTAGGSSMQVKLVPQIAPYKLSGSVKSPGVIGVTVEFVVGGSSWVYNKEITIFGDDPIYINLAKLTSPPAGSGTLTVTFHSSGTTVDASCSLQCYYQTNHVCYGAGPGDITARYDPIAIYYENDAGVMTERVWAEESSVFRPDTMPVVLSISGTTLTVKQNLTIEPPSSDHNQWMSRYAGNDSLAPLPSFVDTDDNEGGINNMFLYKNRLGILSNEHIVFSRVGDYFNFFPTTGTEVLDDDPIDVGILSTPIANLKHSTVHNNKLVVFGESRQFAESSGAEALTPSTISFTPATDYPINPNASPKMWGSDVVFANVGDDWQNLMMYNLHPETLLPQGTNITGQIPHYIPYGFLFVEPCPALEMLFVHSTDDQDAIYVYHRTTSGDSIIQSAWSRWTFDTTILGIKVIDTFLYIVGMQSWGVLYVQKIKLEVPDINSTLGFPVYLDLLDTVSGTYSSANDYTTFTLPYNDGEEETITFIDPSTGFALEGMTYVSRTQRRIAGDYSGVAYIIGKKYTSTYAPSPWIFRDSQGVPKVGGKLKVKRLSVKYKDTGYFKVVSESPQRGSLSSEVTTYLPGADVETLQNDAVTLISGLSKHVMRGSAEDLSISIINDTYLPLEITGLDYEGYWFKRGSMR